ncbi:MAG TPA: hypothetical protein VF017_20825 [Thermoanaerobaculia bacterium]|nr:hypothetical protein [Thermoanaerobaculia bacterium]
MDPGSEAARITSALDEELDRRGLREPVGGPGLTVRDLFRTLSRLGVSPGYFFGRLYPLPGWSPPSLTDWQRPAFPALAGEPSDPDTPTAGELFEQARRLEETRPADPDDLADRFGLLLGRRLAEAAPHPLKPGGEGGAPTVSADLLADLPLADASSLIDRSGVAPEDFWTDLFQVPGASRSWALDSPRWSEVMGLVRRLSGSGGQDGR